jgi:hypothetical protein
MARDLKLLGDPRHLLGVAVAQRDQLKVLDLLERRDVVDLRRGTHAHQTDPEILARHIASWEGQRTAL